jgi:MinD-like ATPase involved in chromosome partitioning or flagellar assembly
MSETELAIALSAREWPDRLRHFLADHGGARVRVAAMGPEDLLVESYGVLLIDDICSFLTPRLIDLVSRQGRVVLGIYDPNEFADGKDRLLECGVADVVEADADPEEILKAIARIARPVETAIETPIAEPVDDDEEARAPVSTPSVIAVGGPSGGVGATEVSIALSATLARRGATVLVEVDESAPSLAQRLGLPLYPNLRTAVDILDQRTGSLERVLHETGVPGFQALPGLATIRDWHEIRPRQALDLIHELAASHSHVVVNIGSRIEADAFGDGQARYGVSRSVIENADRFVAVGLGTPVGVARLLEWLSVANAIGDAPRADVLVNRAPSDQFRRGELVQEITRTYPPASFAFLPDDARMSAMSWDGSVPSKGKLRRAVERWVGTFVGGAS